MLAQFDWSKAASMADCSAIWDAFMHQGDVRHGGKRFVSTISGAHQPQFQLIEAFCTFHAASAVVFNTEFGSQHIQHLVTGAETAARDTSKLFDLVCASCSLLGLEWSSLYRKKMFPSSPDPSARSMHIQDVNVFMSSVRAQAACTLHT
jgi:hypothetical protein